MSILQSKAIQGWALIIASILMLWMIFGPVIGAIQQSHTSRMVVTDLIDRHQMRLADLPIEVISGSPGIEPVNLSDVSVGAQQAISTAIRKAEGKLVEMSAAPATDRSGLIQVMVTVVADLDLQGLAEWFMELEATGGMTIEKIDIRSMGGRGSPDRQLRVEASILKVVAGAS